MFSASFINNYGIRHRLQHILPPTLLFANISCVHPMRQTIGVVKSTSSRSCAPFSSQVNVKPKYSFLRVKNCHTQAWHRSSTTFLKIPHKGPNFTRQSLIPFLTSLPQTSLSP